MTTGILNSLVQTNVPYPNGGKDQVTMKITGILVDMMVELNPRVYNNFVVMEGKIQVICVMVLRSFYSI